LLYMLHIVIIFWAVIFNLNAYKFFELFE
jgi:hypothetical protein